jgi:flagellin
MPLNIISNFAAQVAHRNLTMSDKGASSSVAKISAGTRVLGARDDAAALAIGSRLRAEVAAMTQASVNAGQAVSMLQIADGAMSQINDTLVRMKSLAVQAGSDQLGSVERGLINTEFQQLLTEIERIAEDTEFNGQALINGGVLSTLVNASDPGTNGIASISFDSSVQNESVFQYSYNATGEILTVTKLAVDGETTNTATDVVTGQLAANNLSFTLAETADADDVFTYSYAQATEQLTVTNQRTGESATVDITDAFNAAFGSSTNVIDSGDSLDIEFGTLGVTVTLDDNFDRTAALADPTTTVAAGDANLTLANTDFDFGTSLTATALDSFLAALGNAYDAATGVVTIAVTADDTNDETVITGIAGINFGSGAGANHTVADGNAATVTITDSTTGVVIGTITADFTAGADDVSTIEIDFGPLIENVQTNTSGSDESVQLDLTNSLDAVAGVGNNLSFDQTVDVEIAQFGVSLTLDKSFDRTNDVTTTTGTVTDGSLDISAATFAPNSGFLNADVYQALLDLGYDSVNGLGYNAIDGLLTLQVEDTGAVVQLNGLAGISFDNGVAGENTADLAGGAATTDIAITLADGSKVSLGDLTGTYTAAGTASTGTVSFRLGAGVFFNSVNEDALTNDFTFKIGTGNETFDRITLSLNSVNQQALGINGLDVTTAATADAASTAISTAINTLNTARANVGAFQNRLDIAASNLATARENTEAARSALLDLDVAQEMTTFTSQQILVQAGVSMLAQANQLPQNLLRLLQ